MKYVFCFLAFIGFSQGVFAQTKQIAFDDLPRLIGERNKNYMAKRAQVEAQEERTGHLTRSFLPKVSVSIGEEDFRMTSGLRGTQTNWRLGAAINLYRGGRDSLDEDIRHLQVDTAKIDSLIDYHAELRLARTHFWELVALEKLLNHRREELNRNERNLRSAKKKAGSGVSSTADVNQFELYQMDLEERIKKLDHLADVARNQLTLALGLNEHKGILVQSDFPSLNNVKVEEELEVESQLNVRSQKTKAGIEDLRAKQSGRWWHPEIDAYAYYGVPSLRDDLTPTIREDRETVVGVSMAFDFGQGLEDITEAKARQQEALSRSHRADYIAQQAIAADHEIRHDMRLTAELLSDNEKKIAKARTFLKTTETEYLRGIKNGPDLLSAFRQYYELLDHSIELNRNLMTSEAELQSLVAKASQL